MGETLGNYELTRHLATGGMAEIWIAKQSGAGGFAREIAIKRILPHLAREKRFVDMFFDEARIASALRHPNIVQIYELGEDDGEFFIAMEYIEGADLADLLDKADERSVEFPMAISVRIIADILAALEFAHEFHEDERALQIVHRDVSPHNVLIGTDGIIKLVDFGIAHAVERHSKTETGLVKGKLSYMAPEQVEQGAVDRRADIFACGVLLYELLTQRTPFGRELVAVNAILHQDPPDPRDFRPDIPEELVPIVMRALEKKPDDRYQSAQEMLEDLESVLRSFDKYVSPKHVASFAGRLLNDEPIEGYDDVSQALPRSIGARALAFARTAKAATPQKAEPARPPLATPMRQREDLSVEERRVDAGARPRWLLPTLLGAALLVTVVGVGYAAATKSNEPIPEEQSAPQEEGAPLPEVEADGIVSLELEPQIVGFEFDEEDPQTEQLRELDEAVDSLTPDAVDRMLLANYERSPEDYLWAVRGPHLLGEFTDPPGPLDPGDPDIVDRLDIDDDGGRDPEEPPAVRPPRRKARPTAEAPAAKSPTAAAVEEAPKPTPKRRPAKKPPKKKRKNDLRIIDKAVPY